MAVSQINQTQEEQKKSKLATAIELGNLGANLAMTAGKMGAFNGPNDPWANAGMAAPQATLGSAGTPSTPMGTSSLMKPDEITRQFASLRKKQ